MTKSLLWNTDGYKPSHIFQYPPDMVGYYGYMEARSSKVFEEHVVFGLQIAILREIVDKVPTVREILEAATKFKKIGASFNTEAWLKLVQKYPNHFPIEIQALPEGTVIPVGTPYMILKSTDPEFAWLPGYLESIFVRNWYPSTVATLSYHVKKMLREYMIRDGSDMSTLPFKLHDFGGRGVSSYESGAIGGAAHLLNFMGSDTFVASEVIEDIYLEDSSNFIRTIAAAEHSTITSWGRENEIQAYRNMLQKFPNSIFAVVIDSYDVFNAAEKIWGEELKTEVLNSNSWVVLRPDSGEPVVVLQKLLNILSTKFGYTTNSKGFKKINNVSIIQGDGVNYDSIRSILEMLHLEGFSVDNICFGMGGALLQKVDRDTLGFALKMSSITRSGGVAHPVYKDPVTDIGKKSKFGELTVRSDGNGGFLTLCNGKELEPTNLSRAMNIIYKNGVVQLENFSSIKQRLGNHFLR